MDTFKIIFHITRGKSLDLSYILESYDRFDADRTESKTDDRIFSGIQKTNFQSFEFDRQMWLK